MQYELRAITQEGRIESLNLNALDEASAREQASSRGYTVLAVHQRSGLASVLRRDRGTRFPVLLFTQELLVLLGAGLPLVEAIQTLADKERHDESRTVLSRIVATLRQGRTLSAALEQHPRMFHALYVATVRAGERTSDLVPVLTRFIAYQNQLDAIRKRMVNASIYPALLIAVGSLVSLFLLLYVVPRFSHIYAERSADLPLFSQILLLWGEAVGKHAGLLIAIAAGIVLAAWWVLRRPAARALLGNALRRLPLIGEKLNVYQLARFYRTTGMLLHGGVPLVPALEMSADLLHPSLRERLALASRAISEGHAVSESMERNGLTTAVALRLLTVGEQGGNMADMMERIAVFHDEEIGRWADWFMRLFEPILMALIGLVIGAIVILMYMPIFELAGSLQ